MPDPIQPVAAQIQPPNPNQGIQALSGILGIQQQQQGLQLGQQQIAAGAANLQQTQERNRELSGLAAFSQNAMKPGSKYWDGDQFDVDGYRRDATAIAPVYGGAAIDQHISTIKNVTDTKRAFQQLGTEANTALSGMAKGLATKTGDVTSGDIDDLVNRASSTIGNNATAQRRLGALEQQLRGATDPAQRKAILQSASAMLGGFSQQAPFEADIGPAVAMGTRNVFTGAPTVSGGLPKGYAPTDLPGYKGQVAAVTTAATGAGSIDNQSFGNVIAAGTKASSITDLAGKVKDLAGQIRTGKFTQEFADQLTVLKQHDPQATMRQVIEKYANNLKTTVESAGSTDAEREQIGSGFPTPKTMNPDALEEAANYAIGQGRLASDRAANAVNHIQKNGSTQGFAVNDSAFMKGKSPLGYAPKSQPQTQQAALKSKSGRPIKKVGDHYEYAD